VEYKYISADNHMDLRWIPRNTWQDRVAARFKDRAPRVVETPKGTYWEWEGKLREPSADGESNAAIRAEHFLSQGVETPEGSLPPSDPALLLQHFDMASLWAGVLFGATRKWHMEDPELRQECYRAYNDWMLELNSAAPERIIGLPNLPGPFPELCAPELYRLAKAGAKGVEFSPFDAAEPLYSEVWDPVWAAAEDTDIPICFHIGDKAGTPYPPNIRGSLLAHFSRVPFSAAPAITEVIFSGALERHPNLRVCYAECRIGWLPFLVSWMDRQVREREPDPTAPLRLLPSEYFARQVRVTYEDDMIGARLLPEPWAYLRESAMWGADYPHTQGVWPNPDPVMDEMFAGLDPAFQHEVVFDRAARFFRLKTPVSA